MTRVRATVGAEIVLRDLSIRSIERLRFALSYPHPERAKAIRMRRDPAGLPMRFECMTEWPDGSISVPRGAVEVVRTALAADDLGVDFIDSRTLGDPIGPISPPAAYSYQTTGILRLASKTQGMVVLPCGGGKAQPLHSLVLTPSGFRAMGDIQVGDVVCNPDGSTQQVTGVFDRGELDTYRVVFDDGMSVECCDDHLWLTASHDERANGRSSVKPTSKLREKVRTAAGAVHGIPYTQPVRLVGDEPGSPPLPLDPWLLGAYLGDGSCIKAAVSFDNSEADVIERFGSLLPTGDTFTLRRDGRNSQKNVTLNVRKAEHIPATNLAGGQRSATWGALHELGLTDVPSGEKFVPNAYKFGSKQCRLDLLRGLCDTDGSVSRAQSIEFSTSSRRLAEDFTFVARSLGARISCTKRTPHYTYKGQRRTGLDSYRIRLSFPGKTTIPVSSKKHLARWRGVDRFKHRYIVDIVPSGKQHCRCISVSGQNGLYVTDGYAITHNTRLGGCAIAHLARTTIVLVHTGDLLDQWVKEIRELFGIEPGVVDADRKEIDRPIVVASVFTLAPMLEADPTLGARFGLVLVDEGHHAPALTIQRVLRHLPARYRLALTATPDREDGHEKLVDWSFGPRLLVKSLRELVDGGFLMMPRVVEVPTAFEFEMSPTDPRRLTKLGRALIADRARNALIVDLAMWEVQAGETVLLLSNRKDHCRKLGRLLKALGVDARVVVGTTGKKQRATDLDELRSGDAPIVIATSLADEGLNVTRLSRVILAFPEKARGKTVQRVGRLTRKWAGKDPVLYDVVDKQVETLARRAQERRRAYRSIGIDA